MDFVSAVKSDAFAPVLTYIVPGAFAVGPYVLVLIELQPSIDRFWQTHPTIFSILMTIIVLFVGALLEELGTRLELRWDKRIGVTNWERYLQLRVKDEIVGQRYLRIILMRMKFELSMVLAIPLMLIGLAWFNQVYPYSSWGTISWIVAFFVLVTMYLLWESYQSAVLLNTTRSLIIEAVQQEAPRQVG